MVIVFDFFVLYEKKKGRRKKEEKTQTTKKPIQNKLNRILKSRKAK